jgi:3,4-dihydroxy 2-butanone 4-phosphate synthase/GTP cyclohydrolase II
MKSNIQEILEDYKNGKMIILLDDEDRENEGDLIIAAEKVTDRDINFMATFGKGLICLTLTEKRCSQLKLPLMVGDNKDANGTNFTVSIEAASGVTTGISAADRAKTVIDAVAKNANEERYRSTWTHLSANGKKRWSANQSRAYRSRVRPCKTSRI